MTESIFGSVPLVKDEELEREKKLKADCLAAGRECKTCGSEHFGCQYNKFHASPGDEIYGTAA